MVQNLWWQCWTSLKNPAHKRNWALALLPQYRKEYDLHTWIYETMTSYSLYCFPQGIICWSKITVLEQPPPPSSGSSSSGFITTIVWNCNKYIHVHHSSFIYFQAVGSETQWNTFSTRSKKVLTSENCKELYLELLNWNKLKTNKNIWKWMRTSALLWPFWKKFFRTCLGLKKLLVSNMSALVYTLPVPQSSLWNSFTWLWLQKCKKFIHLNLIQTKQSYSMMYSCWLEHRLHHVKVRV